MVEESQIQELERFLQQSMIGVHHLFEHESIAQIMKTASEETELYKFENLAKIQTLMIDLAKCPTLDTKRRFLQDLDPVSYELVVRTYFQIVDSTLLSVNITKH